MMLIILFSFAIASAFGAYSGSYFGNNFHGGGGYGSSFGPGGDYYSFGGTGFPTGYDNFFSDFSNVFKQQQNSILAGLQQIQQQTAAAAAAAAAQTGSNSGSGGFGGGFGDSSGHSGGFGGSFGNNGGFGSSFSGSSGRPFAGNFQNRGGASSFASASPGGTYQSAQLYPENPGSPNVNSRFGGTSSSGGHNGNGGFYSVLTSSQSGTSNVDGKPTSFHKASTTVNDNGKVTSYSVHNP